MLSNVAQVTHRTESSELVPMGHPKSEIGLARSRARVIVASVGEVEDAELLLECLREAGFCSALSCDIDEMPSLLHASPACIVVLSVPSTSVTPALGPVSPTDVAQAAGAIDAVRAMGDFVPLLVATSSMSDASVGAWTDAGADDLLVGPTRGALVAAKVDTWLRMASVHRTASAQRDDLERYQARHFEEMRSAERVFANVVHSGCLDGPNFLYLHTAMSVFNGDLLLATPTILGGLRVLVGDFTGHGLAAGIGALPVADVFYGMTKKGFSIEDVVREINEKLRRVLPIGRFLAAAVFELDASHTGLTIWSGGLPNVYVRDGRHGTVRIRHAAQHLPLAVVPTDSMSVETARYDVAVSDRIYAFSDGVLEAENPSGERFGTERIEASLNTGDGDEGAFANIVSNVNAFRQGQQQGDDVTLVEVLCAPLETPEASLEPPRGANPDDDLSRAIPPRHWSMSVELDADALRSADPLPLLTPLVLEYQGLAAHWERVFTVLTELYTNAVDHGILQLDSGMKATQEGFCRYYEERSRRLAELREGNLSIVARHRPAEDEPGGRLELSFADSGRGFDWRGQLGVACSSGESTYSGRGLALVQALCSDVQFSEEGNRVSVVYSWS